MDLLPRLAAARTAAPAPAAKALAPLAAVAPAVAAASSRAPHAQQRSSDVSPRAVSPADRDTTIDSEIMAEALKSSPGNRSDSALDSGPDSGPYSGPDPDELDATVDNEILLASFSRSPRGAAAMGGAAGGAAALPGATLDTSLDTSRSTSSSAARRGALTPRTPAPPGFAAAPAGVPSPGAVNDDVPLSVLIQRTQRLSPEEELEAPLSALIDGAKVSVLLCTVTFYANLAHSLTRSP
jgi:hypothetical protein